MKKLNTIVALIGVFFITTSFTLSKNKPKLKWKQGLYIITKDRGSEFELNQTGKFYDIQKTPIININHIISTSTGTTPIINGKRYPTLTLTLVAIGIDAIGKIKDEQEIGLVLNDKLRVVAKLMMFGKFQGPSITLQGTSNDSAGEFEDLKKKIDNSR
jgi:hypothetical protein